MVVMDSQGSTLTLLITNLLKGLLELRPAAVTIAHLSFADHLIENKVDDRRRGNSSPNRRISNFLRRFMRQDPNPPQLIASVPMLFSDKFRSLRYQSHERRYAETAKSDSRPGQMRAV